MDKINIIDGVILTPLKIIENENGDIYHSMRNFDQGYNGFGEAYFSTVKKGVIKAWKKHFKMTLNIVVPVGEIKIVLFDDRTESMTNGMIQEVTLSLNNYFRLTIPPGLWFGFQGLSDGLNMLMNIADIPHQREEQNNIDILNNIIPYVWS